MTYIKIIAAANCLRLPSVPDGSIFDKTFEIDTSIARQKAPTSTHEYITFIR